MMVDFEQFKKRFRVVIRAESKEDFDKIEKAKEKLKISNQPKGEWHIEFWISDGD